MAKIKKHTLTFENDYAYDLIGICSHYGDYRLVWSINEQLNTHFERGTELFLVSGRKGNDAAGFPYYAFQEEDNRLEMYLIKNKYEGKFLIPEKQQIDYFLFVCDNFTVDIDDWVETLRSLPGVMAAYAFDPATFTSTEQIIF